MDDRYKEFQFAIEAEKKAEAQRDKILTRKELQKAKEWSKKCEIHYEAVQQQIIQMMI